MSEETKKRRNTYLELGKLTVKTDGVMRKQLEIASAMNDLDFKITKIFEAYNIQIEAITNLQLCFNSLKAFVPTITKPQQKLNQTVKPQYEPRQNVVPKLPEEIAKHLEFGDGVVKPREYLPRNIFMETDRALKAQGYNYVKDPNGKAGTWRKQ